MENHVLRGDVVWVSPRHGTGSPLQKRRPVVVVQNDAGNRYSPHTIVAAVRHDPRKGLPVHVAVPKGTAGLTKDSVVDCAILATVPKSQLGSRLGRLPRETLEQLDRALAASLGLP